MPEFDFGPNFTQFQTEFIFHLQIKIITLSLERVWSSKKYDDINKLLKH